MHTAGGQENRQKVSCWEHNGARCRLNLPAGQQTPYLMNIVWADEEMRWQAGNRREGAVRGRLSGPSPPLPCPTPRRCKASSAQDMDSLISSHPTRAHGPVTFNSKNTARLRSSRSIALVAKVHPSTLSSPGERRPHCSAREWSPLAAPAWLVCCYFVLFRCSAAARTTAMG